MKPQANLLIYTARNLRVLLGQQQRKSALKSSVAWEMGKIAWRGVYVGKLTGKLLRNQCKNMYIKVVKEFVETVVEEIPISIKGFQMEK